MANFDLTNEERNRIINLHESRTKKLYLKEDDEMEMDSEEEEGMETEMKNPDYTIGSGDNTLEIYTSNDGNHRFEMKSDFDSLSGFVEKLQSFLDKRKSY